MKTELDETTLNFLSAIEPIFVHMYIYIYMYISFSLLGLEWVDNKSEARVSP